MAENLWRDGAVDNIFAPYDWSNGGPRPGDTLVLKSGTAVLDGSNIYGDTVELAGPPGATAPTLGAAGDSNLAAAVPDNPAEPGGDGAGAIDVVGAPQVSLSVAGDGEHGSPLGVATVNIGDYSKLSGGITDNGTLVVNGTATSTFANSATTVADPGARATINAEVVGVGTFAIDAGASLSFTSGVSSGQTINNDGGTLSIEDPRSFHATVTLSPNSQDVGGNFVALAGLRADHVSYRGGLLSLFSGGNDVYDLRLQTSTGDAVVKQTSLGVSIYASATDAGFNAGTVIPHV